jgi:hypothetical protein
LPARGLAEDSSTKVQNRLPPISDRITVVRVRCVRTAGKGEAVRRYGSVNVPIFSIGVIIYGAVMVLAPLQSFRAIAYRQGPFLLVGQRWWGLAFVAAGVTALMVRHLLAVFPLLLVVSGWAVAMLIAAATVDGVSPVAGIFPAMVAVALLVSVSIRGFRPPHLRPDARPDSARAE